MPLDVRPMLNNWIEEYLIAFSINLITTALNLASPYFIKRIIDFIKDKDEPFGTGLLFIFLLIFTQAIYYFISEHLDFYQRLLGVKSTNAMIALIYRK